MLLKRTLAATAAASLWMASFVQAQSLADVARKEEARRKATTASGKVYTNESLHGDAGTSPSAAAPAAPDAPDAQPAAPSQPGPADADTPQAPANGLKKDETYWKKRVAEARAALDRSKVFGDALQSRINALTSDFAAQSDPAQRALIGTNRDKAMMELDHVQKEVQANTKAIADIQEEARKEGVPAGWVR